DAGVGRYVNTIYQGRGESVWIGTTDGLSIWDGARMAGAAKMREMPAAVEAVYEDKDAYVWIGTRRDGLFPFPDRRLKRITTREGLFDNLVGTILEDGGGHFWLTCNRGISRVSRRELLEVVDGKRAAVVARAFGTGDGMPNRECDFGQGSVRARDGRLRSARAGGPAPTAPPRLWANTVPPPTHMEGVLGDGEAPPRGVSGTIASGNRRLEFRYAGLSLGEPAGVRYRYRLESF